MGRRGLWSRFVIGGSDETRLPSKKQVVSRCAPCEMLGMRKMSPESAKAGDRLLEGIKNRIVAQGAEVDADKLRQQGYSESMIARLMGDGKDWITRSVGIANSGLTTDEIMRLTRGED